MPSTSGILPLIPGLPNEVVLEIFHYFVAVDRNGAFTLMLVCSTWRDRVLRSKSIQSLRSRRGKAALVENREKAGEGICIMAIDGGGPGSVSQLRMLDEVMLRLAFKPGVKTDDLLPADYFDLMGGVGFGGLAALLLGRLRMTTMQAMEELATIGTAIFTKLDDLVTSEVNLAKLRNAIEGMLERHHHPVDIKLHDSSDNRCKVVLFAAATAVMDHCHPFRTYPAPRKSIESTFVDAACATIATPEHFSPVAIGPRLRQQSFAGIPHGFDNPTREVVKEAQLVFGETKPVSLVLSLGSGQRARLSSSDHHATRFSRIHCDSVARDLHYQWVGIAEHLRLNVDKGMEDVKLDDWSTLGPIETHTNVYLAMNSITTYIDRACQWLLQRSGSVTLSQLSGTNTHCLVKVHSESLKDYMAMEFKQMRDVVQQFGIEKITLVDSIGNDISIPTAFCLTFPMLLDVINVYFKHQKVPGSDYVERGNYRLVHGNCRNVMGPIKWNLIRKVGLKVEMSMILRTRNQNNTRCPGCRAAFEGSPINRWAECSSCSVQFQIETHVQPETQLQPDKVNQSEGISAIESIVTSAASESESKVLNAEHQATSSGEAEQLHFRLISVINLLEKRLDSYNRIEEDKTAEAFVPESHADDTALRQPASSATFSALYFPADENRPSVVRVNCTPASPSVSSPHGRKQRPQSLQHAMSIAATTARLFQWEADTKPWLGSQPTGSVVLTHGLNGKPLLFPLHLFYVPDSLAKGAPVNRSIYKLTNGLAPRKWSGNVVALKYSGTRRQAYSDCTTNDLPALVSYFLSFV